MKVQLPWAGKATGSSAGLIYQSYWGKTYARTFPAIFHYPNTPAQQACQAKYWHRRIEAQDCYRTIQPHLSSYQKRLTNTYNAMFKSVNDMFTKQVTSQYSPIPYAFGIDLKYSVYAAIIPKNYTITPSQVIVEAKVKEIKSEFQFQPNKAFLVLVNFRRQELWTQQPKYDNGYIYGVWKNTTAWASDYTPMFYIGLADDHFFSNFFLIQYE